MTPEQELANTALEKAITDHVKAFRGTEGDNTPEMVTDWVLVACVTSFSGDERLVAYHMGFSNGQMDDHRAVGLCRVGEDLILNGDREEE